MIRLWIPGFYDSDSGKPRWGDAQVIDDGKNYEVIDGYCGVGTTRLINGLKSHGVRSPYLHISHAHYDHYYGIRKIINDKWFTPKGLYCYDPNSLVAKTVKNSNGYKYVKAEINNLKTIIDEAKGRGIPVTYLKDNQVVQHGDIKIICYRNQPTTVYSDDSEGDSFLNDGSLCYWFPDLLYWTSGDGCEKIYDMCKAKGAKPVFFKIPHHGNNCTESQAKGLKADGAEYCWDNDYNTQITEFLMYGRRRCIEAGIKYINCHGDINVAFANGKAVITKGSANYIYDIPYKGKYEEGWVKNSVGWWYRYADGSWAVGWKKIKYRGTDTWFYFNAEGYMVTGWQKLRWSQGTNWFYFDKNGAMQTKWVKDNGYWYYLNPSTGAMQIGWLDYKGKKCYLEPIVGRNQGHAYCDRTVVIDGETWKFDKDCYGTKV